MAVQAVHLEADAFLVCLNHALSTEKEEVMGLCIGEVPRSALAVTLSASWSGRLPRTAPPGALLLRWPFLSQRNSRFLSTRSTPAESSTSTP